MCSKMVAAWNSDTLKRARCSITALTFHGVEGSVPPQPPLDFVKQIAMLRLGIVFDDEAIDGGLQVDDRDETPRFKKGETAQSFGKTHGGSRRGLPDTVSAPSRLLS
jgi:hypothetical protein